MFQHFDHQTHNPDHPCNITTFKIDETRKLYKSFSQSQGLCKQSEVGFHDHLSGNKTEYLEARLDKFEPDTQTKKRTDERTLS